MNGKGRMRNICNFFVILGFGLPKPRLRQTEAPPSLRFQAPPIRSSVPGGGTCKESNTTHISLHWTYFSLPFFLCQSRARVYNALVPSGERFFRRRKIYGSATRMVKRPPSGEMVFLRTKPPERGTITFCPSPSGSMVRAERSQARPSRAAMSARPSRGASWG